MENIAELQHVSKIFSGKTAVDDVSFVIPRGSVTAVLGPNGAGKTTVLSMMLGLREPSLGSVRIFGQSPKHAQVKRRIGAMLQEVSVIDGLKVHEVMSLIRSYYPSPLKLSEMVHLAGFTPEELNKRADKLSGGQKRRLGFALALAGNPDLLFFDEPTVGLDAPARKAFWQQADELADRGKTILFSTHYLQEAEDTADRILLFNKGKIAADGTPDEIVSRLTSRSVSFIADMTGEDSYAVDEMLHRMRSVPGVRDCKEQEGRWVVTADNTDTVLAAIFRYNIPARDIRTGQGRLDDAFEIMVSADHDKEAVS
ncbi:putative ABC transporter ATP-binding protein YvfR [Paenibacillus sp. J23TS9]|uniref:ABC transporter ATP-binding protein n=1 Tax=Paenibacillus sp. J23TS9 TaxID=2807193 RepID=UPI001B17C8C9|nr:ABC transporter ATP-binding protein [Paenibacillus sp. J23TS9]GIP30709.1 putative ABC transporter ATP-binding protein YvfR [Paenibacillus sp. J23TS9]